ncbi:MAG TPA: hypothetical protein VM290_11080 [Gaiellaceae bacterium]|nr:hypothetical protein [Gaiellaceae bacterium]
MPLENAAARAAIHAAGKGALVLAPLFWLVGVFHFGFVTGPAATPARMASYVVATAAIAVPVLARFLRTALRERAGRDLGRVRAGAVAVAALAPVEAAIVRVTLFQHGDDTLVAVGAVAASLAAWVLLTEALTPRPAGDASP